MSIREKRILLGRSPAEGTELIERLRQLEAKVDCVPLIRVSALPDVENLSILHPPDIVMLTSKNSISGYASIRKRILPHKLAVVGKRTASACIEAGFVPEIVGPGTGSADLLRLLQSTQPLRGKRILYLCSALVGNEVTSEAIRLGASVEQIPVYKTEPSADLKPHQLTGYDAVVFYSGSGAQFFNDCVPLRDIPNTAAVAMGEQTGAVLRRLNAAHVVIARHPDVKSLLDAIVEGVSGTTFAPSDFATTNPTGENK